MMGRVEPNDCYQSHSVCGDVDAGFDGIVAYTSVHTDFCYPNGKYSFTHTYITYTYLTYTHVGEDRQHQPRGELVGSRASGLVGSGQTGR